MAVQRRLGCDEPAAVVLVAEQRAEGGGGVEARKAQPVDTAIETHQCRGVGVSDDGVVLYGQGHLVIMAPDVNFLPRCYGVVLHLTMPSSLPSLTDIVIDQTPKGASRTLRAVVGVPDGSGPWPAVVVVHEAFGVETEMRKQVAKLASLGYLAVMPDLYSDGGARKCLVATMRAMRSGTGRAYADIEAARQWILARPDVIGSVGVIGFCMGGGFALMTAASGFGAAASNYGMLPPDPDDALAEACPVVGSYGARDTSLRGATAALEKTLTRQGVIHDLKEYPDAGHAFMNTAPAGPAIFQPLARVLNIKPAPDAAADAWARIDSFFREHLLPRQP